MKGGKDSFHSSQITVEEKAKSMLLWIKYTQEVHLQKELMQLQRRQQGKSMSSPIPSIIFQLNLQLDENDIIRAAGRVQKSSATMMNNSPILLPKRSHLTKLVVIVAPTPPCNISLCACMTTSFVR